MALFPSDALAGGSVILMIGDGMGWGQVKCRDGLLAAQTPSAWVITNEVNGWTTDSAAAATAYSCGIKTRNGYLAMTPDGQKCETLAQKAKARGYGAIVATTEGPTGATPAAFYAHSFDRNDHEDIRAQLLKTPVKVIGDMSPQAEFELLPIPAAVSFGGQYTCMMDGRKPFFMMIEEAYIDKESHANNLAGMLVRMTDFEKAIASAMKFTEANPDVTLVVTADHETGGLDPLTCAFTTGDHTAANVPLYAYGAKAHMFSGIMENTEVSKAIGEILFD